MKPFKCPECGAAMKPVTRQTDGHPFLGCARYPKCYGSRSGDGVRTVTKQLAEKELKKERRSESGLREMLAFKLAQSRVFGEFEDEFDDSEFT